MCVWPKSGQFTPLFILWTSFLIVFFGAKDHHLPSIIFFLAVTIVELKAQAFFPSPFQLAQSPSPSSLSSQLLQTVHQLLSVLLSSTSPFISHHHQLRLAGPQHRLPLLLRSSSTSSPTLLNFSFPWSSAVAAGTEGSKTLVGGLVLKAKEGLSPLLPCVLSLKLQAQGSSPFSLLLVLARSTISVSVWSFMWSNILW